jgi:Transglutaminase-like superfamily
MQFLFWKALAGLAAYDLLLLHRDFATLHHVVSTWRVRRREAPPDFVKQVCNAVNLACIWYPKQALCLQRSAVTICLLRSNGVAAQMVIGAQTHPFRSHAWVEVNGQAVNERIDVQAIYGVWDRC